jgi:hypothetical protein
VLYHKEKKPRLLLENQQCMIFVSWENETPQHTRGGSTQKD